MVIAGEKALPAGRLDHVAYLRVVSLIVRRARIFLSVAQIGVHIVYILRIKAGHRRIVRVLRIKTDVRAGGVVVGPVAAFRVDVHLIAGDRHKAFVVQIGMIDQHVMVGKSDYRISVPFVDLLQLFDGILSVGQHAVAVHIRLVPVSVLGYQQMFHCRLLLKLCQYFRIRVQIAIEFFLFGKRLADILVDDLLSAYADRAVRLSRDQKLHRLYAEQTREQSVAVGGRAASLDKAEPRLPRLYAGILLKFETYVLHPSDPLGHDDEI